MTAKRSVNTRKTTEKKPLFQHQTGQWAKKIKGRMVYFGADYDTALATYVQERDEWEAGRNPRKHGKAASRPGCVTLSDVVNSFLAFKERQVGEGELSQRTFIDYYKTCIRLIDHFGKSISVDTLTSADFGRYRDTFPKWSLTTIGREVRQTRIVFKFAWDEDLIDRPIKFGQVFREPKKASKRKQQNQKEESRGLLEFSAAEARTLIEAAPVQIKAMMLLGLNCGFGNSDCAKLTTNVVNLKTGWIEYSRGKTGVKRKCSLWPETIDALRAVADIRPDAEDYTDADLFFLTRYGKPWVRVQETENTKTGLSMADPLAQEYSKLLKRCGLKRPDVGFYTLRRTFETIAGDTQDQVAVDVVMGHADESMAAVYRQRVFEPRLKAVSDFVRLWLFGTEAE
mgnify:CR=1 FL=1|jgi:integrase